MFRSIRWRLVLSFAFLTLLTVTLVGVLALSLVQRYVGQQETEQLRTNADAVARQALPLVWPSLFYPLCIRGVNDGCDWYVRIFEQRSEYNGCFLFSSFFSIGDHYLC